MVEVIENTWVVIEKGYEDLDTMDWLPEEPLEFDCE